ncbi:PREDICTED: protein NETWORKED 2A-like [Lupinus angustifolius]|nr:PREDICTED: protein NETWORKED 2A-like [Lupinus angustifolius]
MLHRAASNAYSWWWASHIRTKQSKWLDQSLQDMEEKVTDTLKILDNDGDSFAQRAEMYYKKRPELLGFVEESFRAYRALAERYDHLSKELQSANRTIASVFPDQVQYRVDEDSEEESETCTNASSPDLNNQTHDKKVIPKVPKIPKNDFRSPSMLLSRKGAPKENATTVSNFVASPTSGLTKNVAIGEIDKLQKEMLALQTEKEFVRSLYERTYEKYWDIEDQIIEMQKRVCSLQDEFGVGTIIEDNDARNLMAATAIKSCQETLTKLQEIQEQSSKEAKVEYQRVKEAHAMFEDLRDEFISKYLNGQDQNNREKTESMRAKQESMDEEMVGLEQKSHDVGLLRETMKKILEKDLGKSFSVTEMAEKIDELVDKVVSLETAVTSQTGLVKRLRSETGELQTNIKNLEQDKDRLIEGSEVTNKRLDELEKEIRRVKLLNRSVRSQDKSLQTHFTEASCNLEHLSGKLNDMKPDMEEENMLLHKKKRSVSVCEPENEPKHGNTLSFSDLAEIEDVKTLKKDITSDEDNNKSNLSDNVNFMHERNQKLMQHDKGDNKVSNGNIESHDLNIGEEDQPNWKQMFISGLDDREKILFEEYTSVLRNYKDVRIKLNDIEKKNRDSIFELALQLRELKNVVVNKDKEINYLQQKVNIPEATPDESPYTLTTEYKYTPHEAALRKAAEGGANLQHSEISPLNSDANAVRTPFSEKNNVETTTNNSSYAAIKMTLEKLMVSQDKHHNLTTFEQKFRLELDNLLEENLEFWLRFSTSVHQIQKFQNSIQDLKAEVRTIKENKNSEGHSHSKNHQPIQSQLRPIFRHLREIRTELSLWLEHNAVLQHELQGRYTSLCNIQDKIARAGNIKGSEGEKPKEELSGFQAAKFQGEVLNMKQENSKVASELQAGLSLVKGMKVDVEKTLDEIDQDIVINSNNHGHTKHSSSRTRIPLKSFLFGAKLKRQRQSLFACVSPAMHKHDDMPAPDDAPI